jgi:hypothetical protein
MSCLYCLWDILDDLVFRKVHESDVTKFSQECGMCISSRVWGFFWFIISLVFFVGGILIGLVVFKGTALFFKINICWDIKLFALIEDEQTQQQQVVGFGW